MCELKSKCKFLETFEMSISSPQGKIFIDKYCHGCKKNQCIRKKLLEIFHERKIPDNMMPNGEPIPGTSRNNWDNEIYNYRVYL